MTPRSCHCTTCTISSPLRGHPGWNWLNYLILKFYSEKLSTKLIRTTPWNPRTETVLFLQGTSVREYWGVKMADGVVPTCGVLCHGWMVPYDLKIWELSFWTCILPVEYLTFTTNCRSKIHVVSHKNNFGTGKIVFLFFFWPPYYRYKYTLHKQLNASHA